MGDIQLEARRGRDAQGPRFFRFSPTRAIRDLASQEPRYTATKPYAAVSLIFWAYLDGRPGKRTDPEKRPIYTTDARRAGNIFLLLELHRALAKNSAATYHEVSQVRRLLEETEGYANAIVGDSADELLERCRENDQRIGLVVEIIKYILRYRELPQGKRTIEDAKYFLSRSSEFAEILRDGAADASSKPTPGLGVKKLEKIWAEYVAAAPLLYAVHHDRKFSSSMFSSIEATVDWTKTFCADQKRIDLFLGSAAAVAKALEQAGVRNVRMRYFKNLVPGELEVAPFTSKQLAFIQEMDIKSHPDDGRPYRAPVKNNRR